MSDKPKPKENKVEVDIDVRNTIVVGVSSYRGKPRLDVRHHWLPDGQEELAPTQKGINVPLNKVNVQELIESIVEVVAQATGEIYVITGHWEEDDRWEGEEVEW